MYLFHELLLLSPLSIYVYYRLRALLASRVLKHILTAVFFLLLAGYPVAETLSHRTAPAWTKSIMLFGYYSLPILLYLAMTVIFADLIIGAARLLKIVSRETVRGKKFRKLRLAVVLAIPAAVMTYGLANFAHLRAQRYVIEVPRRSAQVEQFTIVYAADIHLGKITAARFMDRFAAKVNAEKPDIVLIGGDVLEGHRGDEDAGAFAAQFKRIKSRFGIYAAPGNHEGYGGNRDAFFNEAGIRLLRDAVERVDNAFLLAGRNEGRTRSRKSVAELLGDTPDDLPVILMEHRPTSPDGFTQSRVDIKLSGHTHEGQLFPLNIVPEREFELSWGYLKKGRTHFFVTSGIQLWGPPVRTVGASEFLVIRVVLK
jgi:predicted MPP superfamily phosphohydrolase